MATGTLLLVWSGKVYHLGERILIMVGLLMFMCAMTVRVLGPRTLTRRR